MQIITSNIQEEKPGWLCQLALVKGFVAEMSSHSFGWKVSDDGSIPCPKEVHGDGSSIKLELRRILTDNFVKELIISAEDIISSYKPAHADFSSKCCTSETSSFEVIQNRNSEVRQAAFRHEGDSNFLYSPDALKLTDHEIEHFRRHWLKGEPVIVRNCLDKASGLSWEPLVMWRAIRQMGAKAKFKEETRSVRAIDCKDWCEVCYLIFMAYCGFFFSSFIFSFTISLSLEDFSNGTFNLLFHIGRD